MNKAQFLADNKGLSYAPTLMADSDQKIFIMETSPWSPESITPKA